ncbi:23S rRNA (pseudouridine(1915)-N(3))-methyltransferase RlmH [Helicobacter sp. 11S03491-1]|uniref:23S rRNA (pseudouridine(1915)-N(3))-methyltransferase RlmH n=1 Tax=Helicobacter sp. 11S03491-1 TaxID=1476196 RepID=UPI000BA5EFE8|nr:23S rRNA (pseudouridine(1915)-N(3))-methyltransferase RlmH [Helicobacter sp. 11S03491-1]PAF43408.1 hypothetical protein BKH45_01880 [Helicobacter sp. 11S03491-1]
MKCNLYSITKPNSEINTFILHYQKLCKQFGTTLFFQDIMNNEILYAQRQSEKNAKKSYTKAFLPFIAEGKNIALHPDGKLLNSFDFSNLFKDQTQMNFFIGGAYGFDDDFLTKSIPVSLSLLTFSHKIVKIILCEQIYRALSIINHHPYHK